jgi:hypothetical protein
MEQDITFYISIFTGFLTVSEILPYIKSISSNGILQLITTILLNKTNQNASENERLLESNSESNSEHSPNVVIKSDTITVVSQNIKFIFDSPNVQLDFNESSK